VKWKEKRRGRAHPSSLSSAFLLQKVWATTSEPGRRKERRKKKESSGGAPPLSYSIIILNQSPYLFKKRDQEDDQEKREEREENLQHSGGRAGCVDLRHAGKKKGKEGKGKKGGEDRNSTLVLFSPGKHFIHGGGGRKKKRRRGREGIRTGHGRPSFLNTPVYPPTQKGKKMSSRATSGDPHRRSL